MKKDENAAAKKKPKTSAAQIRVQKGERAIGEAELPVGREWLLSWYGLMGGLQT